MKKRAPVKKSYNTNASHITISLRKRERDYYEAIARFKGETVGEVIRQLLRKAAELDHYEPAKYDKRDEQELEHLIEIAKTRWID